MALLVLSRCPKGELYVPQSIAVLVWRRSSCEGGTSHEWKSIGEVLFSLSGQGGILSGMGDVLVPFAALVGVSIRMHSLLVVPRSPPPVRILRPGTFGYLALRFSRPPMSRKPSRGVAGVLDCLVVLSCRCFSWRSR